MSASLAGVRVDEVLRSARLRGASDLHLTAGAFPVLRVDGELERQATVEVSAAEVEGIIGSLLDSSARARLDRCGDSSTTYRDAELGAFRIHAFRTTAGTALAIRLLAKTIPSLDSLHLPAIVATFAERSSGLVLFAGPTGSGKTTAMAAAIDRINRERARHILTIEDPIEYEHQPLRSIVSQREVGRDVPTFWDGVSGALRSDPDVILLGEMREPLTMHAALTAAETGHLVFATLHTTDASQTIDRIVSAFSGEMQEQVRVTLAQTLVGVCCLRLIARAGGAGRRAAAEILVANDAVRTLIRESKTHQLRNAISTGRQAGMQTLESHLSELVMHREIDEEEARRHTERAAEIRPVERAMLA